MPPSTKYIYLNNNGATIYVGGISQGETSQNRYYATTSCTLPSTSFLSSSVSSEPTSATVFDYSGKIFKEWNKSADGSGASYSSGDSYTATSTTDVLYAIWEDLPTPDVVISYNGNTIASLSDSGTEVLETNGTFLADDITIAYTKSGGGGGLQVYSSTDYSNGTFTLPQGVSDADLQSNVKAITATNIQIYFNESDLYTLSSIGCTMDYSVNSLFISGVAMDNYLFYLGFSYSAEDGFILNDLLCYSFADADFVDVAIASVGSFDFIK